jgi:uncharacterized protein YjgD (DUF1641 family)
MAVPITFKPAPVDPRAELMREVERAPKEHAEALLTLWATLQTAHDKGILDLVHGLMGGRDIIASEVAKGMKSTDVVNAMRNMIALSRVLAALDPEALDKITKGMPDALASTASEAKPPSLWQLFKRVTSEDGRRGLSFATRLLTGLGSATKS